MPSVSLWAAFAGGAVLLTVAMLLVGRRYWWIGPAAGALCALPVALGLGPRHSRANIVLVMAVCLLSFALALFSQLRVLRRAYAQDPDRPFGQLMTSREQMRFGVVLGVSALLFYVLGMILFHGTAGS